MHALRLWSSWITCRINFSECLRDMAVLGLIHRTVLGRGPRHFAEFFRADLQAREERRDRHRFQLSEYTNGHWSDFEFPGSRPAAYIANSMLGLVSVYNRLPAELVERAGCVPSFQSALQGLLKDQANAGITDLSSILQSKDPVAPASGWILRRCITCFSGGGFYGATPRVFSGGVFYARSN